MSRKYPDARSRMSENHTKRKPGAVYLRAIDITKDMIESHMHVAPILCRFLFNHVRSQ